MAMARDRLSALSDELLCSHILSKLSLKDAIRCSMLSRRWRCLWTLLPRLNFVLLKNTEIIDNILFFHFAELESLKILFCVSQCEMSWKKWPMCASLKRVKQITLKIKPYMNVLPSLFSCDCLTFLKLVGFDLPRLPLNFCGFRDLRTCSLILITITGEILEKLIAKCPLLENLTVKECVGRINFKISTANLKYLDFTGNYSANSVTGNYSANYITGNYRKL